MAKFNLLSFLKQLAEDALVYGPGIVQQVEQDKANFSEESKTAAAGTALVQASQDAQQIAPTDASDIAVVSAVAGGLIANLKAPAPVTPVGS